MKIKILILSLLIPVFTFSNDVEVKDLNSQYFNTENITKIKDFRTKKFNEALFNHDIKKPKDWDLLVERVKEQSTDYEKLATANLLINQIPYIDNTNGSYMSPYTAFKRGGIVCKDYAVIKYLLLKDAGFNVEDMLFMVHDSLTEPDTGQAHVVLAVKISNEVFIANQYMKTTANKFYKFYGISKSSFAKQISKFGVDALLLHLPTDSFMTNESLMVVKDYKFKQRKLFSLINEKGAYQVAFNKRNRKEKIWESYLE